MIQRDKKEVFGHFLEFGLLDRVDIANCDTAKSFFNTWQGYQAMIDHSKNHKNNADDGKFDSPSG